MTICRSDYPFRSLSGKSIVTIGNFDGVHLGHQKILQILTEQKSEHPDATATLISFYPHPATVLQRREQTNPLTGLRQKHQLLQNAGIDCYYSIRFSEVLAQIEAEDFLDQLIIKALNTSVLIIGSDACVGRNRKGDSAFIQTYLLEKNISVIIADSVLENNERISSTRIRETLQIPNLEQVEQMLGRPYSITGKVTHGDRRGRELGFPTANLPFAKELLPARGVYAAEVFFPGRESYPAVVNIGVRPTFGGDREVLEAHLIDYADGDFYGERVSVNLKTYLRAEQKFDGIEALQRQIQSDIDRAKKVL